MGSIGTPKSVSQTQDNVPPDFPYRLSKESYIQGLTPLSGTGIHSIPPEFPAQVNNPATWSGSDLKERDEEWTAQLLPGESQVIRLAVEDYMRSGRSLQEITPDTFALPVSLSKKLDDISERCHSGLGFCILRGLGDQDQSEEGRAVLFGGISVHVASSRGFQDVDRQHVLAHLFKKHAKVADEYIPPSFNNDELAFHTDAGDMVAFYYASFHAEGGNSLLASGNQIYNELAVSRPDILSVLRQPRWSVYQWDLHVAPKFIPLLHHYGNDGITLQFTRLPFSRYDGSRAQREDVPSPTNDQIEALNALQILAKKHSFVIPQQTGDMIFFNNLTMIHSREPYVETTNAESAPETKDRHILRLWLQDPKRTIPLEAALQEVWDKIYGPNTKHGREEIWNTKPIAAFAMNRENNG